MNASGLDRAPAEGTLAGPFLRSGKVRDLYELDADRLVLIASDRLSAFDVVLPTPIPDKGRVLTGLSRFWFGETAGILPNHLLSTNPDDLPRSWLAPAAPGAPTAADVRGRLMIGRRARPLPVEVIVRGYLAGTGWKDYRRDGAICGVPLPPGLRESDRLPEPIFTPSTKEEVGTHDRNIDFEAMVDLLGGDASARVLAAEVRETAIALFRYGAARAEANGIIVADTKFEFGLTADGELLLIDEVLTPDFEQVLGRCRVGAGSCPGQLRQAVRARLARGQRLGQAATRAGPAAGRGRRHAPPLRGSVRTPDRRRVLAVP